MFANADKTFLWELNLLTSHYNPLIRKFTHCLLSQKYEEIVYKGNPIQNYTNSTILRRFSLIKPKQQKNVKRGKAYQPRAINFENYKGKLFDDEKALQFYFE